MKRCRPGLQAELVVVCHCRKVTDRGICAAIEDGARDPVTLASRCGAGGGCGGCLPALQALLACYGLLDEAGQAPVDSHAA